MATVAKLVTITTKIGADYVELPSHHPSRVDKLLLFKVLSSGRVNGPLSRFQGLSGFHPLRSCINWAVTMLIVDTRLS